MQLPRTKEWREARGLSQRELAAEAGVGESTVPRIERGESVTPPTSRKIADALGVSVSDLLESPPVPLAPAPLDELGLDELLEMRKDLEEARERLGPVPYGSKDEFYNRTPEQAAKHEEDVALLENLLRVNKALERVAGKQLSAGG